MCHVDPQIHGSSLFYDTQLSIIDYIFMILVHIGAHHLSSDTPYTSRFFVGSPHSPHSIYSIPSSCAINFHPFPPFFYLFIIANWLPHIHHWLFPCCIYQITLYNNYIMFHRISTVSLPSLVKYPFLSPLYPSFLLAIRFSPTVSRTSCSPLQASRCLCASSSKCHAQHQAPLAAWLAPWGWLPWAYASTGAGENLFFERGTIGNSKDIIILPNKNTFRCKKTWRTLGKPYFYDKKDSTIGKSLIQKIAKDEMI